MSEEKKGKSKLVKTLLVIINPVKFWDDVYDKKMHQNLVKLLWWLMALVTLGAFVGKTIERNSNALLFAIGELALHLIVFFVSKRLITQLAKNFSGNDYRLAIFDILTIALVPTVTASLAIYIFPKFIYIKVLMLYTFVVYIIGLNTQLEIEGRRRNGFNFVTGVIILLVYLLVYFFIRNFVEAFGMTIL
ncbi:MAG: YIP1 family protein [Bacteroidales bacterium]